MKRQWEETPRAAKPGRWDALYVTMNPRGDIRLSRRAHEATGLSDRFLLLYDRGNNVIGLNPAASVAENAYPAARVGRHGGRLIRAWRLCEEFDVKLDETVRFVRPEVDDEGTMVLDLRTANPVRRHGTRE